MHANPHYQAISAFYGDQRAKRSQLLLMSHIDEGLRILDLIGSSRQAKEAFCIHPLVQADEALLAALAAGSMFGQWALDSRAIVLAMEYRKVANAYLSHHYRGHDDVIALSPVREVNEMLVADKVQNRKDFEIHHRDSHENAIILEGYFDNWLKALGVSESRYLELKDIA